MNYKNEFLSIIKVKECIMKSICYADIIRSLKLCSVYFELEILSSGNIGIESVSRL